MDFNGRAFYIVRIDNLPSILERGILSYNECGRAGIQHTSFADNDVQARHDRKLIPNTGRYLHDYAPTYLNPRNATLYCRKQQAYFKDLCILVIDGNQLLTLDGTVLSDRNAAADFAAYLAPSEITKLNFNRIYASSWNHGDILEKERHKTEMQAEILVPDRISPHLILGVLVQSEDEIMQIKAMGIGLEAVVNKGKFFL